MKILQTVVGLPGCPTPGQTTYQNELFRNAIMQFLIVNNVCENGLAPSGDFSHDPLTGTVTRNNPWVTNDKAIFVYSTCNCN
jgi:hypothetical protein